MRDLRGRVVLVHFWTFGCHNCVQNYPVYRQWARQYDPNEVFMLGIHTPEANYEKDIAALRERIQQEQLSFAVAVDNDKTNWQAWSNQVWPSVYLVDKKGRVRYWWYGELRWQGATGDKWIAERIEELKSEQYP
jgi:thiol-disulfide isomerase/thioredoxin